MAEPIINEIEVKSILSKSNLPVCEYSVNPYIGCLHACKYCYASFMKRFTGHSEQWGQRSYWTMLDKELKSYAAEIGLDYVTNDDQILRAFNAPPVIVNYFYHEQIKKSARKDSEKHARIAGS